MKLRANKPNLKKYAKDLLGNNYSPENEAALIREALGGFVREYGHVSHSRAKHLERLNKILGTHGVEGMILDGEGQDVSGTCDASQIEHDIQYCNAGDTYVITLMYYNGKLFIGDWGSIVETIS